MFGDLSAQIAAEYDKVAPDCEKCGEKTYLEAKLGRKKFWSCPECGHQQTTE